MLLDSIIGFFAALGIFILLRWLKGRVLRPVIRGENMRVSTLISISGPAPELENAVKALKHLRESGALAGEILVQDLGADEDTLRVAELLEREGSIKIIT